MAVVAWELAKSRDAVIDLRAGTTTFQWIALVTPPYTISDDQDLIAWFEDPSNITARYGYQLLRTIETRHQGGPVWLVTLTYGFDEGDPVATPSGTPLPYEFSFDTTGGTQHITQSLDTVSSVKYGIPAAPRTVSDLVTVGPRSVTDATTTAGSTTLTSATAAFTSSDVGAQLSGAGMAVALPKGCTIASVTNSTTVVLSAAALNSVVGNATISGVMITSATAAFVAGDVGAAVSSTTASTIPAGAMIVKVISATQALISSPVLSSQTGADLDIGPLAAVNYNRAIGVSRDGVAGTDVVAPKLEFQMIRNFTGMTLDYIRTAHLLTGTVNAAPFYGYEAGELLFLGASGAPSQNNQAAAAPLVRVTFRFAGSPNVTDIDLVPDDANGNHLLRIPSKGGWDYLWVFYKDDVDLTSRTMRPRPDAAYIEQVYLRSDFSTLLIGT